ncbi:MAG: hypothetical protein JNK82_34720 [Myxococcaceae bacterium]|nr:hypothetical protein [Myxococcaceae bacterium]
MPFRNAASSPGRSRTLVPTLVRPLLEKESAEHHAPTAKRLTLPQRVYVSFNRGFDRLRQGYGGAPVRTASP